MHLKSFLEKHFHPQCLKLNCQVRGFIFQYIFRTFIRSTSACFYMYSYLFHHTYWKNQTLCISAGEKSFELSLIIVSFVQLKSFSGKTPSLGWFRLCTVLSNSTIANNPLLPSLYKKTCKTNIWYSTHQPVEASTITSCHRLVNIIQLI